MFIPKQFEVTDREEIFGFVEANGFAQLISQSKGRLFSTHIPILLSEDRNSLLAHLAVNNPQAEDLEGQEVLVSFQGAHDYISPSWYLGSGVPTWNYQAVHVYGQCQVFREADRLKQLVDALTEKYEAKQAEPWLPSYPAAMLGAIVGIEISIDEIQAKYKLSQNRSEQDQQAVIEQLKANGSDALAAAMQRNRDS